MNPHESDETKQNVDDIEHEIADLERRLAEAKAKISRSATTTTPKAPPSLSYISSPAHHFLLLLSDSALPLGSFAFSSGLESFLAHQKTLLPRPPTPSAAFSAFLPLSISSLAATALPFLLAAHRDPSPASLLALDDAFDAATLCTVARRASVAQGRALLSIWERSLAPQTAAAEALRPFSAALKACGTETTDDDPPLVSAHVAPLFGAIGRLADLGAEETAYVFVMGHVKALVSAGVRAGVFGPYQAQRTLAGEGVRGLIGAVVAREWDTPVEGAGQCVPVMDLWLGRHEVLYSRIFNS
ncbi:urease [Schizothecium vesticola]|uniref:Urease n=1 Tax=Schizothecium vesticola TaxID=314040 RepID=A0AA40KCV0_9PEZI|nr:urease [Schizothecium vesticola]